MTSTQQRAALQRQIWAIANDVRGSVDGWDFKQYVLGTLFYRFISENFASYIEADDDSINYAELPDSVITPDIKDDAIKTKATSFTPASCSSSLPRVPTTTIPEYRPRGQHLAIAEASATRYPSVRRQGSVH